MVTTNKIVILSKEDQEKIAAGQFVCGPSDVVKELAENSIDAHATNITIEIADSGFSIKVKDNGEGIPESQLELAIQKHATSKFKSLNNITTLGFRGEGLFTILCTCEATIISRTADEDLGIRMQVSFGNIIKKEYVSANVGTIVDIKDLFGNIPARRKFLQNSNSENQKIEDIIKKLALVYYNINFNLFVGKKVLKYPSQSNEIDRINEIFEDNYINQLVLKEGTTNDFSFKIILQQRNILGNKFSPLFFFISVNNRPVYIKEIHKAITNNMASLLSKNLSYFLYITTEPYNIDVNVHPSKNIIQFLYNDSLIKIITKIMKEVYYQYNDLISLTRPSNISAYNTSQQIYNQIQENYNDSNEDNLDDFKDLVKKHAKNSTEVSPYSFSEEISKMNFNLNEQQDIIKNISHKISYSNPNYETFGKIKGQLFESIIVTENKEGIFFIDQHAVHERIIFEKIRVPGNISSQMLIEPETIKLKKEEIKILENYKDSFKNIGLDFTINDGFIVVFSTPIITEPVIDIKNFVLEIINVIATRTNGTEEFLKEVACKISIKANRSLSIHQMEEIVKELSKLNIPDLCNHGRRSYVFFPKNNIMNMFDR